MRGIRAAVIAIALLTSTSCGGGEGGGNVTLKVITPAGQPTAVPADQATPIPQPELLLSTETVYQAGAILLSLTGQVSAGSVTALGRTIPLSKGARSLYTFVPIDTDAPAGPQTLVVDFTTTNGSKGSLSQGYTILATPWTRDSLSFTAEQVAKLADPVITNTELTQLREIYSKVTPEKLWDGQWLVPVNGALTAQFGEERSINGGPFGGHHSGTDFGAVSGTPVYATNTGIVVFARQLTVRGNIVVVNHGGGLYSSYAHMSSFSVAEGQLVATGDVVGAVGSTGLSTAAHLHWEIAQSGVLIDAFRFADGSNGF